MSHEKTELKPVERYNLKGQIIAVAGNVTLPEFFRILESKGTTEVALYWTPGPNVFSNLGIVTNQVSHIVSDGRLERLEREGIFQPLFPEATYIGHLGGEKKDKAVIMTTLLPEEVEQVAQEVGFDTTNKLKFQHALDEPME